MAGSARWPVGALDGGRAVLAAILACSLAACADKAPDATRTLAIGETGPSLVPTTPAPAIPLAPSAGVAITASDHPELGTVLADASGRTLYLFTGDERVISNCSGGCVEAFPPLLTMGDPTAEEGIAAGAVGTITREDGSTQVTYNGWPLYNFAADEKPGDAMGQNVGGVWFVVSIHGGPVQSSAIVKTVEHPELGTILAEASGRTLYLFTVDEQNRSNCTGGCARAWPPLLTVGDPIADDGVSATRLGAITREEGSTQVTYNGWPLYYFAPDNKPGDARGQNVGDIWFVVSTHGGPIQNDAILKAVEHPELGTIVSTLPSRRPTDV